MFFLLLKGFAYEAPAVIGAAIASIYITYRGGKNPDSEIRCAVPHVWRLDGWARWDLPSGVYCAPSPTSASASLARQSTCLRMRASSDSNNSAPAVRNSASAIGRVKKIVQ